jgi:hypothetical protein
MLDAKIISRIELKNIRKLDNAAQAFHMGLNYEALTAEFRTQLIVKLSRIAETITKSLNALTPQDKTEANSKKAHPQSQDEE